MKRYIIPKFFHYSNFIPSIKCLKGEIKLEGTFEFTESCRYGVDESSCVNKLFGFCFGFGVHKNSIRFGWTYVDQIDRIFIYSYRYIDGKLVKNKIYEMEIGEQRTFEIKLFKSDGVWIYQLYIEGRMQGQESYLIDNKFITTLGPYFGGNSRAPHKIVINKL